MGLKTFFSPFVLFLLAPVLMLKPGNGHAQAYQTKSLLYNSFIGGFSGAIGGFINKKKNEKWHKAFFKGFLIGTGGGALMHGGKRLNFLIAKKNEPGYAYLSRLVFSAGNSIVENAAANRVFWSVWHYDIGFIRVEFNVKDLKLQPRIMPLAFAGTVFIAANGKFDPKTTLRTGTPTFHASKIFYSPRFVATTPTNGILYKDSLRQSGLFNEVYAHEMIHAFQFLEYSGCNYFFKPMTDKWKNKSPRFAQWNRWVYGDLNYGIMGINYFLVQKGHRVRDYCHNFLENEAESLSTGRPACPQQQ